jgi:NADPH:quinone reductase-like Zn-dependent oxidoreductase
MGTYRRVESPEGAGLDGLRVVQRVLPAPGPGECVVQVQAAALNRSDLHRIRGEYGGVPMRRFSRYGVNTRKDGDASASAYVPGMEAAGLVLAVGADDDVGLVGRAVLVHSHLSCGVCDACLRGVDNACEAATIFGSQTPGMGAWSEQVLVPVSQVMPLPESLQPADVVGVEVTYGPVWWGLHHLARLSAGDVVAIQGGAAGLGLAALEVVRQAGAVAVSIVRDASSPRALALVAEPNAVVVESSDASADWFLARFGSRPRIVLDLVGAATFRHSLDIVAAAGIVLVIGAHSGVEVSLRLDEMFSRNIAVQGVGRAPTSVMKELVNAVADGVLKPRIAARFALDDVVLAARYADEPDLLGRVLLIPGQSETLQSPTRSLALGGQ